MSKIDTYLSRPTEPESPERAIQDLVTRAAFAVTSYRDNPNERFTGQPDVRAEFTAYALVEAVHIATRGEITESDFIDAFVTPKSDA